MYVWLSLCTLRVLFFPKCNQPKLRAVAQRGPGGTVRRAPRDLVGLGRRAGLPTGEARGEGLSIGVRMCMFGWVHVCIWEIRWVHGTGILPEWL